MSFLLKLRKFDGALEIYLPPHKIPVDALFHTCIFVHIPIFIPFKGLLRNVVI